MFGRQFCALEGRAPKHGRISLFEQSRSDRVMVAVGFSRL